MKKEIDLKLLKVIHTIVTSGTVTEAARKLNQSPGNISYQLGKVREITGGHLFIRTREGMKPDATALELSQRYQQFIDSEKPQMPLGAQNKRKTLNINTWSLIEMLFTASALSPKDSDPGCRFIFNAYVENAEERQSKLKNQIIDIDIGNKLPADNSIGTVKLFTSGVSVLMGTKNGQHAIPFSLQALESSRHVVWSATSDFYSKSIEGAIEMARLKASRDVAVVSGSLINMVSLCASSNYIMLIPDFFTPMLEKNFQVKCQPLPEKYAVHYDCYLHYHTQLGDELLTLKAVCDAITKMAQPTDDRLVGVPFEWQES